MRVGQLSSSARMMERRPLFGEGVKKWQLLCAFAPPKWVYATPSALCSLVLVVVYCSATASPGRMVCMAPKAAKVAS